MDCREKFVVEPGKKVRLSDIDPSFSGKHESHEEALPEIQKHVQRMAELQYLLYADGAQSLLIVLQALDAAGKDGTIRHLFAGMNPQGTSVFGFKQPSAVEAAHDFLWRAHSRTPGKGEVVIFNRSHYEDVLVVRVHKLAPREVWSKRYALINDFEEMLRQSGTRILKFFLHISPEEQLARFKRRLDGLCRRLQPTSEIVNKSATLLSDGGDLSTVSTAVHPSPRAPHPQLLLQFQYLTAP